MKFKISPTNQRIKNINCINSTKQKSGFKLVNNVKSVFLIPAFKNKCDNIDKPIPKPQPPSIIYIIRHCDKPDIDNNLCSEKGYERAVVWSEYFESIGIRDPYIYGANYRRSPYTQEKIFCPDGDLPTNGTKIPCQGSERMILTLCPTSKLYQKPIDIKYCTRDPQDIIDLATDVNTLRQNNTENDIIICWNHDTMPELINEIIDEDLMKKWSKLLGKECFNVVFSIDIKNNVIATLVPIPGDKPVDIDDFFN